MPIIYASLVNSEVIFFFFSRYLWLLLFTSPVGTLLL